ncbi:RING finger protein 112 isoform X2 [Pseudophryne corroboree]|uniref:RING finger protein 112 isoform X2 n=1 Tax=Pseudophryne corroboree TaxID=495146 RepID=UPI0030814CF5
MGTRSTKPAVMPRDVAASFSKLEEEITCSVCLHELTDPVSIACGHTFCRACITAYWATAQPQGYLCPECRSTCPKDQLIPAYRLKHLVTKVQLVVKEEKAKLLDKGAPASAVPLVYTDPHGRLQLDESVIQSCFLDGEVAGYPLCLICVIGETRRGKSTLMNYILRALHSLKGQPVSLGELNDPLTGFAWSRGTDSLTKGIWMWNRPFILERNGDKMAVFVLDTEGSLDIESDRETSIKLSALSMLLSSYLIFNVNASLKTTELDYLEMYLDIAELTGESCSLQYLQHLDLLLRDWQNPDNCGREAAQTYMEHETQRLRKNSTHRRVLLTLRSPSVGGFLLPHPGKQFLRSAQGSLADMDDDFRSHLGRYISDLVGGVWQHHKTDINGMQVTCAHVGRTLKEFVSTLQQQHYSFASPIEMFHSLENRKNIKNIIKRFQDFMNNQAPMTSSPFKILGVTPSKMRSIANAEATRLVGEYENLLKGDNRVEMTELTDEVTSLLTQEEEKFCSQYSKRFTKCAVGIGCAVGGGVLSLAGGIVGAAVAGTVLAAEAAVLLGSTTAAVVAGAVSGSVTLGAIGTGVGAGVGGVIGHKVNKREHVTDQEANRDSSEDTKQLVNEQ